MAKRYTVIEEEEKKDDFMDSCIGGSVGCLIFLVICAVILIYLRSCLGCSGG